MSELQQHFSKEALKIENNFEQRIKEKEDKLLSRINQISVKLQDKIEGLKAYELQLQDYEKQIKKNYKNQQSEFQKVIDNIEKNVVQETLNTINVLQSSFESNLETFWKQSMDSLSEALRMVQRRETPNFLFFKDNFIKLYENCDLKVSESFQSDADNYHVDLIKIVDEIIIQQQTSSKQKDNKSEHSQDEDEIDKKFKIMEQKEKEADIKQQELKKQEEEKKLQAKKNLQSGILAKLQSFFSKQPSQETQATQVHLGNESNFKWDPIKKRYIFEGEEEEEELDLPPPPKKIEKKEDSKNTNDAPKNNLVQPPANRLLQKPKAQLFNPVKQINTFKPNQFQQSDVSLTNSTPIIKVLF